MSPPRRPTVPGTRRGFGRTPWGAAWVEALETRARLDANRLPRGRTYARWGHVGEVHLGAGRISAGVSGSRATPYVVRIDVRPVDDADWERLLDLIASQVGNLAALLDGDLPAELIDDARRAGVDLLPGPGDLQPHCSCPDWADPCKHAAAVCYLVADALDTDPFALLALRGRSRDQVLAGLRSRRGPADAEPAGAAPGRGVAARDRYAAVPGPLPRPPLPPATPGRPAPLVSDPPASSGIDAAGLVALAADAARRAHELATGRGDGGLGLDEGADLARRAAALVGVPGTPGATGTPGEPDTPGATATAGGAGLADLARRARRPWRDLAADGLAWAQGGPVGLAALHGSWEPDPGALRAGRTLLGPGARVQANRVTLAGRQLRLGTDGRWYPYAKVDGRWQPDGEPIDGPVDGPGDDGPDGGGGDPVGGDPVGGDRPERGRRAD